MVPIRAIFEALGYSIEWDQSTLTATAVNSEHKISAAVGQYGIYVDEKYESFDVPSIAVNGRMLVPVRAIAEGTGADVRWDGEAKAVYISRQ